MTKDGIRPKSPCIVVLVVFFGLTSAFAAVQWVDKDGICRKRTPCFETIQAAVNAASPGDFIKVFPGVYQNPTDLNPGSTTCGDDTAPTVIIYKDNIKLFSIRGPKHTVIEANQPCVSNPSAVSSWTNGGVSGQAAPNAVTIVANGAKVRGFTIRAAGLVGDTAGVFIGGLTNDDMATNYGAGGARVERNIISGLSAIRMYSSPGNRIYRNVLSSIGAAVIGAWDSGTISTDKTRIVKNRLDGSSGFHGISIGGTNFGPRSAVIYKNRIKDAFATGISLFRGQLDGTVISKNRISSNQHCIALEEGAGTKVRIVHNHLESKSGFYGIFVNEFISFQNSDIHHNRIRAQLGVVLASFDPVNHPISGNRIRHNRIYAGDPLYTISLQAGTYENRIYHNVLRAGTQNGSPTVLDLGTDNKIWHNH